MRTRSRENELLYLVQRAKDGNCKSTGRLAEIVRPKLQSYIYRHVQNVEAAGDLVQETLLKMIRSLPRLKTVACFWGWLFTIATNLMRDYFKRRDRSTEVRFSVMDSYQLEGTLADESQKPDRMALANERKSLVTAAIGQMQAKRRHLLRMRYYEGMSYSQIGREVGCSEVAARIGLLRARQALKRNLKGSDIRHHGRFSAAC